MSNANKVVSDNKDVMDNKRGTYQKNLNHPKELVNLKFLSTISQYYKIISQYLSVSIIFQECVKKDD